MPDWIRERVDADIVRQLSVYAHEAEMKGDLHSKQLELIHEHRWFRMFIPRSMGGLGLTLPEVVKLEEALAWADGSTAWVATLCGGAGWFVGFVEESIAREFFTADRLCIAGSGSATGIAEVVEGGYRINGSWPYASGALHATTFTANCVIYENGHPQLNVDGSERILPFILKPNEVIVKKTWGAAGMIATASHSFSISNIVVPSARCFDIVPGAATLSNPVYQYPFMQLAEATLAANISGMTARFLDLTADCVPDARNGVRNEAILKYQGDVSRRRKSFIEIVDKSWNELIEFNQINEGTLQRVSQLSYELVRACRVTIDVIYPLCGMNSGSSEGELNRVWRNIDTALSHALFRKRLIAESSSLSLATKPTASA
ncbi:MAG: acyl-CoA dehydrogenase [Chryseolinea sp.]